MKQNPYALALIGLMVVVFGIVDILFVNAAVGTVLLVIGGVVGYVGLNQAKQVKAKAVKK